MPVNRDGVLRSINKSLADMDISPKNRLFEITKALCDGGCGFTRSQLTHFLTDDSGISHRTVGITEKVIGQWFGNERNRQLPPTQHLEAMLDAYYRRSMETAELDRLKYEVATLRLRAAFDKKGLALKLFGEKPRERVLSHPVIEHGEEQAYSFWCVDMADAEKDLDPFVTLSAEEPDIENANAWLTPDLRRQLYTRWLQWCPRSFVATRRYDPNTGTSPVVAISIIMPLSVRGAARILAREVKATTLSEGDIGRGPGEALNILLDTWILRPEKRNAGSGTEYIRRRTDHGGYGGMMLPLHIGFFWDSFEPLTLIIEPASPGVAKVARMLGMNYEGKDCYSIHLPAQKAGSHRHELADTVAKLRSFPVMNLKDRNAAPASPPDPAR